MRKIIIIIGLVMLLSFTHCLAESIDVTSMSTEELLSLRDAIKAELEARSVESNNIMYPGTYVVGVDIVEGEYLISPDSSMDDGYVLIRLYASEEAAKNGEPSDVCQLVSADQERLKFQDGNVIKIFNYPCTLEKLSKASWAP